MNTLKLIIASIIMLIVSIGGHYLFNDIVFASSTLANSVKMFIELVAIFVVDIILYIATLLILKEDLVFSFIRKHPKEI